MKVSYKWLEKYFESKIPTPEVLSDLFTAHTFEVESLDKIGDDYVFDFKILPDRAHYLLSHRGVAREVSVLTSISLNIKKPAKLFDTKATPKIKINVKDENLCRRYVAQEIDNVTVKESPEWLKNFLLSIGQKSINNIVDISNYVMLDMGQPLHMFDAEKIDGEIIVRKAKAGEKIVLLTGDEVTLNESDLVIADNTGPLAIAGVKGGKRAEVNSTTKKILIEAANFEPSTVRKTSTRLNLRNDSSKRFENEITPSFAEIGMDDVVELVVSVLPEAKILARQDIYPRPVTKWNVTVSPEYISSLCGIIVTGDDIEKIMKTMGCGVEKVGNDLRITPPLERLDLVIPEDIADEVSRINGYEKLSTVIPPELKEKNLPDKTFFYGEKIKNILISFGYSEALLYSLVSKGAYEVIYPLANDKSALREYLATKMADALVFNARNSDLLSLDTIKLCEVGKVFRKDGEKIMLALGVRQIKKIKGITSESILAEDVENLKKSIGSDFKFEITKGEFGAIAEIDFDYLLKVLPEAGDLSDLDFKPLSKDKKYQKFSQYPFMVRDIAIFVPESVSGDEVYGLIKNNLGPLCIKSWQFDVFTKEIDGVKKTSYAYRMIFQSFERTLEEKDVNEIMEGLNKEISKQKDWQVR